MIRNSDGVTISSGVLSESATLGTSDPIDIGSGDNDSGLTCAIVVTGTSPLEANDSFSFKARPDNRSFTIEVEGVSSGPFTFASTSYTSNSTFADAFNLLVGAGVDFKAIERG